MPVIIKIMNRAWEAPRVDGLYVAFANWSAPAVANLSLLLATLFRNFHAGPARVCVVIMDCNNLDETFFARFPWPINAGGETFWVRSGRVEYSTVRTKAKDAKELEANIVAFTKQFLERPEPEAHDRWLAFKSEVEKFVDGASRGSRPHLVIHERGSVSLRQSDDGSWYREFDDPDRAVDWNEFESEFVNRLAGPMSIFVSIEGVDPTGDAYLYVRHRPAVHPADDGYDFYSFTVEGGVHRDRPNGGVRLPMVLVRERGS